MKFSSKITHVIYSLLACVTIKVIFGDQYNNCCYGHCQHTLPYTFHLMKKLQYNCYGHGNSGYNYANNTFTKSNQLVRICYRDKTHQKLFAFWCVLGKTHQKYLRFLVCFQAFFSFFFVTVTIFSQNTPKSPKKNQHFCRFLFQDFL